MLVILGGLVAAFLFKDTCYPESATAGTPRLFASLGTVMQNRYLWTVSIMAMLFITVQLSANAYVALYLHDIVLVSAIPDEKARVVVAGGFLALCQMGGIGGRVFWGLVSGRPPVFPDTSLAVFGRIEELHGMPTPFSGRRYWLCTGSDGASVRISTL